jgi:hypothetical protein
VLSLSQRIQRLQLPVLEPADVVAVFHPKANAAKAAAVLADTAQLQQLKQVLLGHDVRDEFDRNVLHLAVSRRWAAAAAAAAACRQLAYSAACASSFVYGVWLRHEGGCCLKVLQPLPWQLCWAWLRNYGTYQSVCCGMQGCPRARPTRATAAAAAAGPAASARC